MRTPEINDHYGFRFPTEDDAAVAPHSLHDSLEHLESLAYFEHSVHGVRVAVTLSFEPSTDEEERAGAEHLLEAWASSSGGVPDATTL